MDILYIDDDLIVCIKPPRILSTDEPGGLPELIRNELGNPKADVRTVHRLDRVVSGLMVVARNAASASELSRQIREDSFEKSYLAVLHGVPEEPSGLLRDLLGRDKVRKMTYVAEREGKGIQEALLYYELIHQNAGLSRVKIKLLTGRTHQIRVQFASRDLPLVGERKYSTLNDPCELALWSCGLKFRHPKTNVPMAFSKEPPAFYPWTEV